MSSSNKHTTISRRYITEVLELTNKCPRPKCEGLLVSTFVRYKDHGPVFIENECCNCGRVVRRNRLIWRNH